MSLQAIRQTAGNTFYQKKKKNRWFQILSLFTMKCKQKLCQRSKNINENGNCIICDDAINEATRKVESSDKATGNVEIDLNLMIEIHNKLSNGVAVEPKVVSGLLLGGAINIINQHVESDSEDQDDNFQPEKNQCHICRKQLHSEDDFMDHVRDEHFQGMLD